MEKKATHIRVDGPHILMGLLILLCLALGAFLVNEIAFFNVGFSISTKMSDVEYSFLFAAFLAFYLGIIFVKRRYFPAPTSWPIFAGTLVFFGLGVVAIFAYPESKEVYSIYAGGNVLYSQDLGERFRDLLWLTIACLSFYLLAGIAPRCTLPKDFIRFSCLGIILTAIFALVWSLIFEWKTYVSYFQDPEGALRVVSSFLNNRNTFGTLLLLAVVATFVLHCYRPFFFHWIIALGLLFEMIFVFSKTAMVIGGVSLFIFAFYRFILTMKGHALRNWLALGLIALTVVIFYFLLHGWLPKENGMVHLYDNLVELFGKFDGSSFDSRMRIWEASVRLFDGPVSLLFGLGYRNVDYLEGIINHATYVPGVTHNGWLEIFLRSGILGSALALAMLVYLIYATFDAQAKGSRMALPAFFTLLVAISHGATESTDLFRMDGKSMVFALFALYLPLAEHYRAKHADVFDEAKKRLAFEPKEKARVEMPPYRKAGAMLGVIVPLIAAYLGLGYSLGQYVDVSFLGSVPFGVSLVFGLMAVPYAVYAFCYAKTKAGSFFGVFFVILFAGASIALSVLFPNTWLGYVGWLGLPIAWLIPYLATFRRRQGFAGSIFIKVYMPYFLALLLAYLATLPLRFLPFAVPSITLSAATGMLAYFLCLDFTLLAPYGEAVAYPYPQLCHLRELNHLRAFCRRQIRYEDKMESYGMRPWQRRKKQRFRQHPPKEIYP